VAPSNAYNSVPFTGSVALKYIAPLYMYRSAGFEDPVAPMLGASNADCDDSVASSQYRFVRLPTVADMQAIVELNATMSLGSFT
jgi:hypothetical protein